MHQRLRCFAAFGFGDRRSNAPKSAGTQQALRNVAAGDTDQRVAVFSGDALIGFERHERVVVAMDEDNRLPQPRSAATRQAAVRLRAVTSVIDSSDRAKHAVEESAGAKHAARAGRGAE